MWQPQSIDSDLTAFITNMPDGWPTLINTYIKKYARDYIRVALSKKSKRFPFFLYEENKGDTHRVIQLQKESDEWQFYQNGPVMHFEQKEVYSAQPVSSRLNNKLILYYLEANNIDISKDKFWIPKLSAVEFTANL